MVSNYYSSKSKLHRMRILLQDDAQSQAAAMGIPVFSSVRMVGNTGNMLKAWKYFTSYEGLQSLVILNNDITVVPGSFKKLHRCTMKAEYPGSFSGWLLLFDVS